jgi:nitronate monooxygenase
MNNWPDHRLLELLGIELPIIQAPMAGETTPELVAAVSEAGGLGSLGCAIFSCEEVRSAVRGIRELTDKPFNLNFFCHHDPAEEVEKREAWLERLRPFYAELGLELPDLHNLSRRKPFSIEMAECLEDLAPPVLSFHFGLPSAPITEHLRSLGCKILSSATTPREARWLAAKGADVIIAQGAEAGGHRATFNFEREEALIGGMALVPQIVDSVELPVVAAGGIADGRGIAAAFALGASGVQIGTAYLLCDEAEISPLHRAAIEKAEADDTVLSNVFTGRPARVILNRFVRSLGPMSEEVPPFPLALGPLMKLRERAEAQGSSDFTPLYAGQSASLARQMSAYDLTRLLAEEARECLAAPAQAEQL